MSLNHIINQDADVKYDIFCSSCECATMKVFDTLEVKDMFVDAKNGDPIELSSLANQGVNGQVIKSNGDGTIRWDTDDTGGGVAFNGSLPTADGQLSLFSSTDGLSIKNSTLTEADLLTTQGKANTNESDISTLQTDVSNLQNDKLNIDGTSIMSGNLQMGFNSLTSVNNITAIGTIAGNINANSLQGLLPASDIPVNTNLNFLSVSDIKNVNNLQTQEVKSTDGVSINIQDDINMGLYDISNCNEIKTNNISTNTAGDVNVLNTLDMNNNDIVNCNEIKTDNLTSSTTTEVKMNSDLNLNGQNIIGLDLINGIQPSGGLYSESSGFSTSSTTEIDILGQGASSGSLSIPANTFTALSMYSFKSSGVLTGGTNDLFTLRANALTSIPSTVLLGEIMVTLQDNGLVNVPWDIMIDFTIRSIGIAGTASLVLSGAFRYTNNNDVVRTFLRTIVLTTGFDTTVDNTLQLTFQNDGTDPLTSFRIDQASFTKWY